jgi:predicted phage terminase large subunit-like protein
MPTSPADVVWEVPPTKIRALKERRAKVEALRREAMRRQWATPGSFAQWLDPTTRQTPALELIDAELAAVQRGEVGKLAIYAPPQEGKSERAVRRFATWLLALDPTLRIVIASYEQDISTRWGRQIKRDIEARPDLQIRLRADSQAAGRWETDLGGGIYCTSIKGAFTGRPADVLIIDDPVKDRAAAESKLERKRAWDFWENVAKIRAHRTVLIQTRWHVDDLGGRLEKTEPGEWRVVKIPAIADSEDDPLGREIGEEMTSQTPDKRPPGWFTRMRASLSAYVWSALFGQSPTAGEGNIFKRGDWRFWQTGDSGQTIMLTAEDDGRRESYALDGCFRFITMDLATSTKTSADWTVATAWAATPSGDLVVLDRIRERVPEDDHASFVAPLRQRWLRSYDVTYIESRMFGTTLVYAMGRAGVPIEELEADADKVTRALAASPLVKQHRVWLPRHAPWLDEWLDEHADFPNAKNDDQVDNTGYAARVLITRWLRPLTATEDDAIRAAERDARATDTFGDYTVGTDLLSLPL